MNNENGLNGLPPEVRKFMDKYLATEEDRALFLAGYQALKSDAERAHFHQLIDEPVDEAEIQEAIDFHERLKRNQSN
jgi:anti-sigma factor RsiW